MRIYLSFVGFKTLTGSTYWFLNKTNVDLIELSDICCCLQNKKCCEFRLGSVCKPRAYSVFRSPIFRTLYERQRFEKVVNVSSLIRGRVEKVGIF
jgi:hypothetical protein